MGAGFPVSLRVLVSAALPSLSENHKKLATGTSLPWCQLYTVFAQGPQEAGYSCIRMLGTMQNAVSSKELRAVLPRAYLPRAYEGRAYN